MKKYEIEINDEVYRVSVKELEADAEMSTNQSASETNTQSTQKTTPQPTVPTEGPEVNAPMAGTVLKTNVSTGDSVSEGDILIVLEAMKMENEIVAPTDGVVGEIFVSANDRVESDQVLLTI